MGCDFSRSGRSAWDALPADVPRLRVSVPVTIVRESADAKKYTGFVITVKCDDEEWQVVRRYSDFVTLHESLLEAFKHIQLPPLPPKTLRAPPLEGPFIESRRVALEMYLQDLLMGDWLPESEFPELLRAVAHFLEAFEHLKSRFGVSGKSPTDYISFASEVKALGARGASAPQAVAGAPTPDGSERPRRGMDGAAGNDGSAPPLPASSPSSSSPPPPSAAPAAPPPPSAVVVAATLKEAEAMALSQPSAAIFVSSKWSSACRQFAPRFAQIAQSFPRTVFLQAERASAASASGGSDAFGLVASLRLFRGGTQCSEFSSTNTLQLEAILKHFAQGSA